MTGRRPGSRTQRGGCAVKLLLLLVIFGVLAAAAWVLLLPRVLASVVESRTGFPVRVQELSVNPFTANAALKGLVLENPAGWPASGFVELREFRADVDLLSLFGPRLEADEVVIDISRVTLVRNDRGVLNALRFKQGLVPAEPAPGAARPGRPAAQEFLIRRLVVRVDRVAYEDYSGRRPSVKEYPVRIERELRDVDSVAKLISPLYTADIAVLTEALGGVFTESVEMLKETSGALKEAGQKAGEAVKGLLEKLRPKN